MKSDIDYVGENLYKNSNGYFIINPNQEWSFIPFEKPFSSNDLLDIINILNNLNEI